MTILKKVNQLGQQVWLDNLSHELIQSNSLQSYLNNGVMGVTTNPAIFNQAFQNDAYYIDAIRELKKHGTTAQERYEQLAIHDVQEACEICLPLYQNNPQAGLVSLEVSPALANDAQATILEAKRLWQTINHPNAMIKIPATEAGIQALVELVAAGINVNMTLIFSLQTVQQVIEAHYRGLKWRSEQNQSLDNIQVVASVFMSRIDTALDLTLPEHLQGKTAISIAKAAYQLAVQFYQQKHWQLLEQKNASPLRLLWASTGTKNKNYSDTLYVDQLIGQNTINTIPEATLNLFLDHGCASNSLPQQTDEALAILEEISQLGIDLEALATRLQQDGLQQFENAFAQLLTLTE